MVLESKNILVIGDYMLDSYWIGKVERISPEAPVPVFSKISNRCVVGGSANVAANLLAAGQKVFAASVIGDDKEADQILQRLCSMGCDTTAIIRSKNRKTTVKTRLLAKNNQQLLRIDEEDKTDITEDELEQLKTVTNQLLDRCDTIVLSDYLKGVLTTKFCEFIIGRAKSKNIPVFCDIKGNDVSKYSGATLLKPNRKELADATGLPVGTNTEIEIACRFLSDSSNSSNILVTLGSKGMVLYTNGSFNYIPCEAREVYDVSGAGDTTISYLVACYTNGMSFMESAKIANVAAGIKVGKVGTATVSAEEVDARIKELAGKNTTKPHASKVVTIDILIHILRNNVNKKIVFTNGCFDILHAGHVMYLNKASEFGDLLIVGVNSDGSVKRLKGESRPVNNIEDRTSVIAGLGCVDYVVVFDEDTPEELIKTIRPDVLVKGADYEENQIVGADFVKGYGGTIQRIPLLKDHSTTGIINKMHKL